MRRKLIVLLLVILILLFLTMGTVHILTNYVYISGALYSKNAVFLDLRGQDISLESFRKLSQEIPDCDILWEIPFQNHRIVSTETEITVTELSDEDVLVLTYFPALETVYAENCQDYPQLADLQLRYSQCRVLYSVPVSGKKYDQDTESIMLSELTEEDAAALCYLPKLNQVAISGCDDYVLLQDLQQKHPEWNLSYTIDFGDDIIPWDTETLEVYGVTYDQLARHLPGLPKLKSLYITNPNADFTQLQNLREQYPSLSIQWEVDIYGKLFSENTTEVDISGMEVESCEEIERLVACLPDLKKLIMSDCGIDNETMAQFRERQRDNYKVVWTVYLSDKCKVRTDDTYFMPIQQGEYYLLDEHTVDLKYCEDMVCIDVGHHMIHNIDFVAYMPHLKYLILAHTGVRDLSPIVNCKELVYLEIDWSEVKDYSPLVELTSLEDLNLNETYCDITPILKMTWLKNLWAPGRSAETRRLLTESLPDTHLQLTDSNPAGEGWRNLPNYYAMRDYLGMPYMK